VGNDSIPIATDGDASNDPAAPLHEKAQKILDFLSSKSEQHDKKISIMGRQVSKGNLHKSQNIFFLPKYMKNSLNS
jgi:hypothetical protein